jgi:signal transduction histidine kinase
VLLEQRILVELAARAGADEDEALRPALLGGLGAPTAIQSLTVRAALPTGRPGGTEPADLDALRSSRVAALEQELRATLALISGYSQSLAHLTLDESSRRRYLDQLPVAAAHLAGVTTEILEICVPREESTPRPIPLRRVSP